MAHSNLLGSDNIAVKPEGTSVEALGTSGNSDSGSDVVGTLSRAELQSDSDATGTGERADVERDNAAVGPDIRPDQVCTEGVPAARGHAEREIDQLADSDDAAPGEEPSV